MVVQAGRRLLKPIVKPVYEHLYDLYAYSRFRVGRWSPYVNIYHCCTQKTASQWFRRVLCDPVVYKYTGLKPFRYAQLGLRSASFDGPLPERMIGIHLYIDHATYASIPKPESYRTFFILRDPRDIVVSWYFSAKYSHRLVFPVPKLRQDLEPLSFQEGLNYLTDAWDEFGLFEAQRSWMTVPENERDFEIFRYEEFAQDNYAFLKRLFAYCEIEVPQQEFDAMYDRHKFSQLTHGREQGVEDPMSHFRKGMSGDWRNYFDDSVMAHFRQVTGDLLDVLGYED